MAILMVNGAEAGIVSPFFGLVNFKEGILSTDGMSPIGAGLQDPEVICWPLVIGKFGDNKQKLMKLFVEVREGTCPIRVLDTCIDALCIHEPSVGWS